MGLSLCPRQARGSHPGPALLGWNCFTKGSIVALVTLLSFPCRFLLLRNSAGDNCYPCFGPGGKCSVNLGLFSGKELLGRPGLFTSCLMQLSLGHLSALPGENQLLALHKSSLRALMAILGIPGFVSSSGSSRDWAWQAEPALSIISPSVIEPLCIQRALGRICCSSAPSPHLILPFPVLCSVPAQEKRHFWELTRQLLLLLPNIQEMPLESPVGWQRARDCPLHTQPSRRHWESWECIQWDRAPSSRHQAGFAWEQRILECFGLEGP